MDNLEFAQYLEKRTETLFERVIDLSQTIQNNSVNKEIVRQLIRSCGSIAANYIEANEALSKKDFFYRIRVCRKESKETRFWLKSLARSNSKLEGRISILIKETIEFVLIFSKILESDKKRPTE